MPKQFIMIMTDTQRTDMLGCYGNSGMVTPCIDSLCENGIRFDKAYTAQPVCGPARSTLFTGLYPHSNGSWSNCVALESTVKTIGQRLTHENIATGYIGKWHLDGGDYFGTGRCPDGWNPKYWYDMRNFLDELSTEDRMRSRDAGTIWEGDGYEAEFTFAHKCSNRAIEFIKEHQDKDFFLVVSYDEPHGPFIAPKKYPEMYKDYEFPVSENIHDTLENKPEHHKVWAGDRIHHDRSNHKVKYPLLFGANSFVDSEIGRVLEAYRTYTKDALILYTSDHGDHLDAHRIDSKGASMYEEIIHIPFILSGTPVKGNKVVNEHVVSHADVVPTILDYFNATPYSMLQGHSLIKVLDEPTAKINDAIFSEFGRYEIAHDSFGGFQPIRCIRTDRYKLVLNLLCTDELYDLKKDPHEMHNLIAEPATSKIRDALHDQLLNWMNETRDPFRGYYWSRRPWRTDAPPATWYDSCMTRQKEPDYDEVRECDYATGLPITKATYRKF